MTKQELIDHLEHLAEYVKYSEDAPALREVIEMLKCSEMPNDWKKRTQKRTETHACDLISRSAAITAIQKAYSDTEGGTDKCAVWKNVGLTNALHIMQDLPSAQSEPCEDAVSRKAAIKCCTFGRTLLGLIDELRRLPSVTPEQRWIPTSVKPYPNLPEEDMSGYFLVTLHTYGNIGFDMDEYEVKKMRWDRVNGWVVPVHSPAWIEEALTQDVLAWRPCPEPYREGGVK